MKGTSCFNFNISQNIYFAAKEALVFGKKLPILQNVLGVLESAATDIFHKTLHTTDLVAAEQNIAMPHLKRLDDSIFSPILSAGYKLATSVMATTAVMLQPIVCTVMPSFLGVFGVVERAMNEEDEQNHNVFKPPNNPNNKWDCSATTSAYYDETSKLDQQSKPSTSVDPIVTEFPSEASRESKEHRNRRSKKPSPHKHASKFSLFSKREQFSRRFSGKIARRRQSINNKIKTPQI